MASNLPAPCKRHFIPTFDSFFNENKKRKLNSQQWQDVRPASRFPVEAEAREAIAKQAQSNELERIKLVEAASYGFQPSLPKQPQKLGLNPLSSEERELTDILKRPKFRAKPVPRSTYYTPAVPAALKNCEPQEKHLTLPQPFALSTDVRGYEKQCRRNEDLQRQQREDEKKRSFQAKPMPCFSQSQSECSSQSQSFDCNSVLSRLPQPTVPEPFSLHSSQRFEERQAFELRLRQKEEAKALLLAKELEDRRRQEEQEVKLLRQKTVFKAQPIFRPGAFVPTRSRQKLTRPESPHFSQKSESLNMSQGSFLSQDWSFFKE